MVATFRRAPWAVLSLIAVNVAVGIFTIGSEQTLRSLGFTPSHPNLHSAFSSLFVHAHLPHLSANMLFLWLFGHYVEAAAGARKLLALYLIGGLASVGGHYALGVGFHPNLADQALVGASGAISALVGYFALRFYRARLRFVSFTRAGALVPIWLAVLAWAIWQAVGATIGASHFEGGPIGYWAHLSGFLAGLLIAAFWGAGAQGERDLLIHEAEEQLRQAYPTAAIKCLEPLVKRVPPDAEALRLYAEAWDCLGNKVEAGENYAGSLRQCLALSPKRYDEAMLCARRLMLLGALDACQPTEIEQLVSWALGQKDAAAAALLMDGMVRAFRTIPGRASLMLRLANLYRSPLGRTQESIRVLRQIVEEHEGSPEADAARFRLNKG